MEESLRLDARFADGQARPPEEEFFWAFLGGGNASGGAFASLCQLLTREYLGRLRRYGVSQSDAQDIVQHLFVRLWERRGKLVKPASARAYLLTCLHNEWASWVRSAGNRHQRKAIRLDTVKPEDSSGQTLGGIAASPEEELTEVSAELSRIRLSDCVGSVFQEFALRYPERAMAIEKQELDDWRIDEIAAVLGRTYAATKQFLASSRKALRELVERRCAPEMQNG